MDIIIDDEYVEVEEIDDFEDTLLVDDLEDTIDLSEVLENTSEVEVYIDE